MVTALSDYAGGSDHEGVRTLGNLSLNLNSYRVAVDTVFRTSETSVGCLARNAVGNGRQEDVVRDNGILAVAVELDLGIVLAWASVVCKERVIASV